MKKLFFLLVFGLFAVSAFSQTVRTRSYFHNLYITGYKPTQTNYRDLWVSVFWPNEDTLALTQIVGIDGTLSTDATLSTASNRQISSTLALKTYIDAAVAGGVADGDKGDVDVSSGGTVWTVDTSAITTIKIASGAVDSTKIATGGIGNTDLAAGIVTTTKVADDAITLAKQASGTANRLQGFDASGNPSEITVGAPLTLSAGALDITQLASNGLSMDGDTTQLGGSINEPTEILIPLNKAMTFGTESNAASINPLNDTGDKHFLFIDPTNWGIGVRTTFGPSRNMFYSYQTGFASRTRSRYSTSRWESTLRAEINGTRLRANHFVQEQITGNKIYGTFTTMDTVNFNGFSTLGATDGSSKQFYAGLGVSGSGVTDGSPWKGTQSDTTFSYSVGYSPNGTLDFRYIDVLLRDTTADAISFYDGAYKFNNAAMSTTSGDTTIMAWVGGNNPIYLDKTDFGGGGGSGTVSSGTTNTVAKYTGATTVGNSSITDDGSVVTVDVSGQTALVATGGLHAGISARSDNASGNSHLFLENSADNNNSYRLSRSDAGNLDLIRSSAYPYGSDTDTIWTYNQSTGAFAFKVSSITNNGTAIGGSGTGNGGIYEGSGTVPSATAVTLTDTINFDSNTFVIDGTNNRVGIGTSSPAAQLGVRKDNIGVTQDNTYGIVLNNTTAATAGNQQMSPGIRWRGNGWKTNATAASQTVDFLADVLPVQGASAPTANWQLKSSINGGAYNTPLSVTSSGALTSLGSITAEWSNAGFNLSSSVLSITGYSTPGLGVTYKSANSFPEGQLFQLSTSAYTQTSGSVYGLRTAFAFAPTSGTAIFTEFRLAPTINQTGGANGITRGVYVNPTLTSAADWRSIETSNTTGYSLYTASAPSYFGGNVGIGTTSADRQLHNEVSDAATNTVTYSRRSTHITSGTAAAQFGVGAETELENASGTNVVSSTKSVIWTDATNGSEDAHEMLSLVKAGTLDTVSVMKSTGQLQLTEYGGGAFTGTPTYQLSADVNGNLIETAAPLNATATLDFPSTAINTCSELTITVTGAADGDVVALGTPNAVTVTGAVFTAWVSATNTVTVQYCNTSTVGAGNPASADFKIRVFK